MAKEFRFDEGALFVFRPAQVRSILEGFRFQVRYGRIRDERGKAVKFYCCEKEARPERLGRIMPGSLQLICDDPLCFDRYAGTLVSE